MRIIDSNLIIYFATSGFEWLNDHIQTLDAYYSKITKLEVLGYQKITPSAEAKTLLRRFEGVSYWEAGRSSGAENCISHECSYL